MIFFTHSSFLTPAVHLAAIAVVLLLSLSSSHRLVFVSSQQQQQQEPSGSGEICDQLSIGSYYFLMINAWPTLMTTTLDGTARDYNHRHGEVMIMGFEDIPGGLDLYLTDKAWSLTSNKFVEDDIKGDGILKFTTPTGVGIPAGTPFGVRHIFVRDDGDDMFKYGTDWIDYQVNGTKVETDNNNNNNNGTYYFDLGDDGDQIFLYCIDSNGNDRPLTGISYNGPFINHTDYSLGNSSNDYYYGTNRSSAPDYLLNTTNNNTGTLVMPYPLYTVQGDGISADSVAGIIYLYWQYVGPMTGLNFYEIQEAIQNTQAQSSSQNGIWLGTNPDGTTSSSSLFRITTMTTRMMTIMTMMMIVLSLL